MSTCEGTEKNQRSSDTRIRRDLKGQLLDYAATALVYRVKTREFRAR